MVTQPFALRQPSRLGADLLMRLLRRAQVAGQALLGSGAQMGGLLEGLPRLLRQSGNGTADLQQLRFGVAHQLDEDFALAPALAPEAAHDLVQFVLPLRGLRL